MEYNFTAILLPDVDINARSFTDSQSSVPLQF